MEKLSKILIKSISENFSGKMAIYFLTGLLLNNLENLSEDEKDLLEEEINKLKTIYGGKK